MFRHPQTCTERTSRPFKPFQDVLVDIEVLGPFGQNGASGTTPTPAPPHTGEGIADASATPCHPLATSIFRAARFAILVSVSRFADTQSALGGGRTCRFVRLFGART